MLMLGYDMGQQSYEGNQSQAATTYIIIWWACVHKLLDCPHNNNVEWFQRLCWG